MDSFTERMMERAKARKDRLKNQLQITDGLRIGVRPNVSPLKESNFANSFNSSRSPSKIKDDLRSPHKVYLRPAESVDVNEDESDENLPLSPKNKREERSPFKAQVDLSSPNSKTSGAKSPFSKTETRSTFNVNVRLQSPLDNSVRSVDEMDADSEIHHILQPGEELTIEPENNEADENLGFTRSNSTRHDARHRLKKLGALYGGRPSRVSSPIQQTEEQFAAEEVKPSRGKSSARLARLAALASEINQWEDDVKHVPISSEKTVPTKANDETPGFKHSVTFHSPNKSGTSSDKSRFSVTPHQFIKSNYQSGGISSVIQAHKSILKNSPSKGYEMGGSHGPISPVRMGIEPKTPEKTAFGKPPSNLVKSPMRPEIRTNPLQTYSPSKASPVKQQPSPFKADSPRPFNLLSPNRGSPVKQQGSPFKNLSPRPLNLLSPKGSPRMGSVLQKAIAYEQAVSPTKTPVKDPAELTLAERKALFEKNKGNAILPKVPFGQPLPAHSKSTNTFVKGVQATSTIKPMNQACSPKKEPVRPAEAGKVNKLQSKLALFEQAESHSGEKKYDDERQKELDMLRNRWAKFKNIPDDTTKEKPISPIMNKLTSPIVNKPVSPSVNKPVVTTMHPKTASSSPMCNPPPMPEVPVYSPSPVRASISPIKKAEEQKDTKPRRSFPSVRPIIVSPPKPGHLYPSLSDVEGETESEAQDEVYSSPDQQPHSDSENSMSSSENSLRREILHVANEKIEASFNRKRRSSSSDLSNCERRAINTMDDFLDEALSDDDASCPLPSKQPRNQCSFPQQNSSSNQYMINSEDQEKLDRLPLTHTVSFYRKLQNQNASAGATPVKKFVHQTTVSDMSSSSENEAEIERELVEKKIAELQQKISTEQTVISQATQALNLCFLTVEFSNSTEQVEAERLLLLATQKRQAALNELQRLKIERTLRPNKADSCYLKDHGSLIVSEITLPIKIDAIRNAAREEMCHHFVCLLKCDENVYGTSLITAAGKSLQQNNKGTMYVQFPNKITFPQLYSDFKITLEVYNLVARSKEVLPHDIKYHISNKKDTHKLRITPKKHKADSRLVRPPVQSPAGPSAVRTSSFSMVGYAVFSLREIQRTQFTLNKVSYTSPLEGVVQLKMNCELSPSIEHRGFLTMFEDVSGFGAWHRRWCLLKGDSLSYWKYPDDETTRVPIDTIDLNSCTTKTVNVVSRDICARPNTLLLETIRPPREEDVNSLVLVRHPTYTLIRHLLSADTKEERVEWCEILNKALAILRAWGKK